MIQTGLLPSAHTDIVTDAAWDFYGLRLATCGVDQRIKVWQQNETTGQWSVEDDWKAHDGPITSLSWAHPEYGTLLASASADRTTKVWERRQRWTEVAALGDARGGVRCVAFAPRESGLRLATLAVDGVLRVYECLESGQWTSHEELDMASPALAAVDAAQPARLSLLPARPSTPAEQDGGWSISWCKEHYWGPCIAVASASSAFVRIIHFPSALRPQCILSIHVPGVTSVAWAPLLGRKLHLLAIGTRHGHVRIFTLKAPADGNESWTSNGVADFDDHAVTVSKVEWNLTGTVLASSGHDGRVRLWKASYSNIWRGMGYVTAEAREDDATDDIEEEIED